MNPSFAANQLRVVGRVTDESADEVTSEPLRLDQLLTSVEEHFPLILAALLEVELADAEALRTRGAFDSRFVTKGKLEVDGFYENERLDVNLEQPIRSFGATVMGGYRVGTGSFPSYDGKAKTDEGGEFRLGVKVPLLQGRAIDPRRVAEWKALLQQERAEPLIRLKRLEATQKAAHAYWKWVAAGRRLEIAEEVLGLAERRHGQIELGAEEGLLAPIAVTDNQRSIVERRTKRLRSVRKMQEAAIALSLFLRDANGQPRVPLENELPPKFPAPRNPEQVRLPDELNVALEMRPELQAIKLELAGLELEERLAENKLLPKLDVGVFASQDVGPTINSPDDKGQFELSTGLVLDVPLQRRSAKGKSRALKAKLKKGTRELQFARDVIVAEVQDSVSALNQSWLALEQATESVRLAQELAEAEQVQMREGESDLFRVNLREQQSALAGEAYVSTLEEHFRSLATYRAVLGIAYDEVVIAE